MQWSEGIHSTLAADFNDFSAPFLLASILAVFPVIIAGIWLPESSSGKKESSVVNAGMKTAIGNETYIKNSIVAYLLLSFVSQFALSLFEATFVLHAQTLMNFHAAQLGSVFMVCGFVMAVAQGTTVAGFIERFGANKILPFGFLFMGVPWLR
ncbi:MAG: MFS transporter [Desulfobulbaceae bacterium]|nr:MFS transporter [Desulfobulbaceae bacterium]